MKLLPLSTILLSAGLAAASCPTITSQSICTTCTVNECLRLSTVTIPCGCPTTIPTTTVEHPCEEKCPSLDCAGTSYASVTEPSCTGCPTITDTVRAPDCTPPPPPGGDICAEPACLQVKQVTWPCSCVGKPVPTATVTEPCTCRSGCAVSESLVHLPCPTSPGGDDGPGCPA